MKDAVVVGNSGAKLAQDAHRFFSWLESALLLAGRNNGHGPIEITSHCMTYVEYDGAIGKKLTAGLSITGNGNSLLVFSHMKYSGGMNLNVRPRQNGDSSEDSVSVDGNKTEISELDTWSIVQLLRSKGGLSFFDPYGAMTKRIQSVAEFFKGVARLLEANAHYSNGMIQTNFRPFFTSQGRKCFAGGLWIPTRDSRGREQELYLRADHSLRKGSLVEILDEGPHAPDDIPLLKIRLGSEQEELSRTQRQLILGEISLRTGYSLSDLHL